MGNKIMGEITVSVGDKDWILVCDFNALADYEDRTGEKAFDLIAEMDSPAPSVSKMRQLMLSSLLDRQPDATLRDAGRVMSADQDALARAFDAAFPEPDAQEADVPDVEPGEETAAQV